MQNRIVLALIAVLLWGGYEAAEARGGRGRRTPQTRRNAQRKQAQARERSDQRLERVAAARMEYARRERQEMWDLEAVLRRNRALERILDSVTE